MSSFSININKLSCKNVNGNKVPSGCAVFGALNESGKTISGRVVIDGISVMRERSNGLGGGFAAYGIYPEYQKEWAFHIFYDDVISKKQTEDILEKNFNILFSEQIPTRANPFIASHPIIFRYFLSLKNNYEIAISNNSRRSNNAISSSNSSSNKNKAFDSFGNDDDAKEWEEDFVVNFVMDINTKIKGAYIISSGKNMGIFKGVGYPEDIGEFYQLDKYKGYLWTAHGRFPTNSISWWGGAHPFGLLNWSVVHNGEISSYGTNKRFINGFGYSCTLSTDTEVATYLFDLLVRRQNIPVSLIHLILAPPLWEEIEIMSEDYKNFLKTIRIIYSGALINGPFSIIVGHNNFMYALNDRIKLRPLVAAKKDDFLFVSSEESAIRKVCPLPDILWHPRGGEPVIGILNLNKEKSEMSEAGLNEFKIGKVRI